MKPPVATHRRKRQHTTNPHSKWPKRISDHSDTSARSQIKAVLKLANVSSQTGPVGKPTWANLEQARKLAEAINHPVRLCQIQYWIGRSYYVMGRFEPCRRICAAGSWILTETLGDDGSIETGPVNLLARVHCLMGEPVAAISYAATQRPNRCAEWGTAWKKPRFLAFCLLHMPSMASSPRQSRPPIMALRWREEVGHLPTIAACLMFRGVVNGWFGKVGRRRARFRTSTYTFAKNLATFSAST